MPARLNDGLQATTALFNPVAMFLPDCCHTFQIAGDLFDL
jgi:hypothetical protein